MNTAQLVAITVLVATLAAQAALPKYRLLCVVSGAAVASVSTTLLTGASTRAMLADVPWDVIVIVVALGLLSELLASSRIFNLAAVAAIRVSRGSPLKISLMFTVGMYAVSGVVNNLTALLLVLPILLGLLKLLGASRRYVRWTLGPMLIACNLGGAATPIGDFPAILLLGRGAMDFDDYLVRALPQTLIALGVIVAVVQVGARPARSVDRSELGARLAVRTMTALHRNIRIDARRLVPGALALAGMLLAWMLVPPDLGIGAEAIAWMGAAAALAAVPKTGENLLRRIDVETGLFLFALFVLVGAVRESGALSVAAAALLELPVPPSVRLALFLVAAALLTAAFSAGPSMAALLDVADALAEQVPPHAVYVGLAMSVCAGSSLFLTAATSGPLAQSLTERAHLREPDGSPIRFDFGDHLPVGLIGFGVTLGVGLAFALLAAA